MEFHSKSISFTSDGGTTGELKAHSDLPVEISTVGDWINYTYENGILTVSAAASSNPRQRTPTLKTGDREEVFVVTQIS